MMRHSRKQRSSAIFLSTPLKASLSVTVTIWFHLLVSQLNDFTNTFETATAISEVGYTHFFWHDHVDKHSSSRLFQAVRDKTPLDSLSDGSPEQQIQRHTAARENHVRHPHKYSQALHLHAVSKTHRFLSTNNQSETDASGPSTQDDNRKNAKNLNDPSLNLTIPSWLSSDAQKQVHLEDSIASDDNPSEGRCKAFNHSVLRPTHGCQMNRDTLQLFCAFSDLRVDNTLIHMERGGERLEDVMGREEKKEFPVYSQGAFHAPRQPLLNVRRKYREATNTYYIKDVLRSFQYPTSKNKWDVNSTCVEMREGTTFLLTRYEYVNLYHTLTDWWNLFFVMTHEQRNRRETIRVLFLDGHAQGSLDSVWTDVFGPVEFVQHFAPGGVCLERAVLVPSGYISPLFPDSGVDNPNNKARMRCPHPKMMERFCNFFLTAFGLEHVKPIPGKIVIIDRKPYISHPRSNVGKMARVLRGLDDLKQRLLNIGGVTEVEIVRLEGMSFAEQIRIVRQAQILIGNHGAGLSHLVFMDPNAHVLEFSVGTVDFFDYLAKWKGIHHQTIAISNGNQLSPKEIRSTSELVQRILSDTHHY